MLIDQRVGYEPTETGYESSVYESSGYERSMGTKRLDSFKSTLEKAQQSIKRCFIYLSISTFGDFTKIILSTSCDSVKKDLF